MGARVAARRLTRGPLLLTLLAALLRACDAAPFQGCFGNCSGFFGACVNRTCACPPGRTGIDCAVGPPPPGGACAATLWGGCHVALRPRIYVHNLPANLTWLGNRDFGRETSIMFLDRLLYSQYRTADPADADFFFIPSVDHAGTISRAEVLEHVRVTAPAAWARANGSDHIMIGTNDIGVAAYLPDRAKNAEQMRLIFLSHMGLWLGSRRGGVPGGFIPGQDIVVPSNQPQMAGIMASSPLLSSAAAANASAADAAAARHPWLPGARPTLFFFAGSVVREAAGPNVRWAVADAARGHERDMHVVEGSTPAFHAEMTRSRFCLGAPGQVGGWGRRATTSALHGCVPVFIQDNTSATLEELLPWRTFAVRFAEAQVPRLHALLTQLEREPGRLAALQAGLACAWPRFVYSTAFGAAAGEDGTDDAFESVMTVLRRRISADWPADWPANGDVDAARGTDAASRAKRLAETQLRDVCAHSSVAGPAGAGLPPPAADVAPRLPCRHWGHPLSGGCPAPPPAEMLADPTGPPGGAVCVGTQPPCVWPRAMPQPPPPPPRSPVPPSPAGNVSAS